MGARRTGLARSASASAAFPSANAISPFTTASVLANDSDPDPAENLTITSIDTALTLGQVSLQPNGTFHYDPSTNQLGSYVLRTAGGNAQFFPDTVYAPNTAVSASGRASSPNSAP